MIIENFSVDKIRGMLRKFVSLFTRNHSFLVSKARIAFLSDQQARYQVYDQDDDDLAIAYDFYLSSYVPNKTRDPNEEELRLFDKVLKSYQLMLSDLKQDSKRSFFVGEDWETFSSKARQALLSAEDKTKLFMSLGARNYKTLGLPSYTFEYVKYLAEVKTAISLFSAISLKYKDMNLSYNAFDSFFYPNFKFGNSKLNNTSLYSFESTAFILSKLAKEPLNIIAEIGAGDGSLCRDILSNRKCKYIIFDLPEMLVRSSLFLADKFKDLSFCTYTEYKAIGSITKTLEQYNVILLPCWEIENVAKERMPIDLWINTHSLGEMPLEISKFYIAEISKTGKYFFSINRDEALSWKLPSAKGLKLIESGVESYIAGLANFRLLHSDYPLSSNPFRLKPDYVRMLFEKK